MTVKITGAAVLSTLIGSGFAGTAKAATYNFVFDDTGFSYIAATGTITTSDTLNRVGGYDVTSITGMVEGSPITGLVANPNQPDGSDAGEPYSDSNLYDNVLFPAAADPADGDGLLFNVTNPFNTEQFHIFSYANSDGTDELYNGIGQLDGAFTVTPAAVPEPATMSMAAVATSALLARRSRRR